jgi:ATP-binding cassette subfamily B protein
MMGFRFYHQHDAMDCGPACLQMIARHYGKRFSLTTLRERCYITREGVSLLSISDTAESIGFRTLGVKITLDQLVNETPLPCIAFWNQRHFVVIYKIAKRGDRLVFYIADPAHGKIRFSKEEFIRSWIPVDENVNEGFCLVLEPTPELNQQHEEPKKRSPLWYILSYLTPHRNQMFKLALGMLIGSAIQLVFPFLTQAIVDTGIRNNNLSFIVLILLGQLALFLGLGTVEFVRGWILLHISTRINITMISDFLLKIMKLPLGFFDSKMIGDLMQRINDHHRIQSFLTVSSLSILFSTVSFIVFGVVLLYYNILIFFVFLAGSLLYAFWIYLFLKRRRQLDYVRFSRLAENQSTLIQLITGMQEIKLNNSEQKKRSEWEGIQEELFKISIRSLLLNQYQSLGAFIFLRTKDIFITFLSASLVIKGELTLGMMLAIQYILGQMNNPVEQMVNFIREAQDATISIERIEEINAHEEEEDPDSPGAVFLPSEREIRIEHLSYQYEGPHSPFVLHDMNLQIPERKVTAIVGSSGSGKTTLIKLLLGFYKPVTGIIRIGDTPLDHISCRFWRRNCGSVMQDGYIFSESIAHNIALGEEKIDEARLRHSLYMANLGEFIDGLPMGVKTKIGQDGHGISEGQRQRILIARAVYRNPEYLFFDEATNALDANNEKIIIGHLNKFFTGKTVIIVAHRLSTVKNADQIVVLDRGKIVETGTHHELSNLKGKYYELVKNQLDLG